MRAKTNIPTQAIRAQAIRAQAIRAQVIRTQACAALLLGALVAVTGCDPSQPDAETSPSAPQDAVLETGTSSPKRKPAAPRTPPTEAEIAALEGAEPEAEPVPDEAPEMPEIESLFEQAKPRAKPRAKPMSRQERAELERELNKKKDVNPLARHFDSAPGAPNPGNVTLPPGAAAYDSALQLLEALPEDLKPDPLRGWRNGNREEAVAWLSTQMRGRVFRAEMMTLGSDAMAIEGAPDDRAWRVLIDLADRRFSFLGQSIKERVAGEKGIGLPVVGSDQLKQRALALNPGDHIKVTGKIAEILGRPGGDGLRLDIRLRDISVNF